MIKLTKQFYPLPRTAILDPDLGPYFRVNSVVVVSLLPRKRGLGFACTFISQSTGKFLYFAGVLTWKMPPPSHFAVLEYARVGGGDGASLVAYGRILLNPSPSQLNLNRKLSCGNWSNRPGELDIKLQVKRSADDLLVQNQPISIRGFFSQCATVSTEGRYR